MAATFLDIAITPDVMDVQHEMGSDSLWQTPRSRRQPTASATAKRDDRHPRQLLSGDGVAERLALHSASRRPAGVSASAG